MRSSSSSIIISDVEEKPSGPDDAPVAQLLSVAGPRTEM